MLLNAVTVALNHEERGRTHKEYQTLSLFLINVTVKGQIINQEQIARECF